MLRIVSILIKFRRDVVVQSIIQKIPSTFVLHAYTIAFFSLHKSKCIYVDRQICHVYNFLALILSEFDTTDTEDIAMAKPANTGLRSHPKKGYNTPEASGMPTML